MSGYTGIRGKPEEVKKKRLKEELRRVAGELEKTPTSQEFSDSGRYSVTTYQKFFGSWNEALREAGLEINTKGPTSEDELLESYFQLAKRLKRTPSISDVEEYSEYAYHNFSHRFNGLRNTAERVEKEYFDETPEWWEIDIPLVAIGGPVATEVLIEELRAAAVALGRSPTAREMDAYGDYNSTTFKRRFGSWNEALELAGLQVNRRVVNRDE